MADNPQSKRISYAWDLNWDIKTQEDAQHAYLAARDKLRALPEKLAKMEELARQDNFELPTADYPELVLRLANEIFAATPDKLVLLETSEDGALSWVMPVMMQEWFYQTQYLGEEATSQTPTKVVDTQGREWKDYSLKVLFEVYRALKTGSYTLFSCAEFDTYLTRRQEEREAEE